MFSFAYIYGTRVDELAHFCYDVCQFLADKRLNETESSLLVK